MKEYEAMPEKGDSADLPEVCRKIELSMQRTVLFAAIACSKCCCAVVHVLMRTGLINRHLGGSLV
jgi:hypothetical protein